MKSLSNKRSSLLKIQVNIQTTFMQAVDMAKIFNNKEKQMDLDKRMNLDILKTEWTTQGITG
jgi:hypothetical protein